MSSKLLLIKGHMVIPTCNFGFPDLAQVVLYRAAANHQGPSYTRINPVNPPYASGQKHTHKNQLDWAGRKSMILTFCALYWQLRRLAPVLICMLALLQMLQPSAICYFFSFCLRLDKWATVSTPTVSFHNPYSSPQNHNPYSSPQNNPLYNPM